MCGDRVYSIQGNASLVTLIEPPKPWDWEEFQLTLFTTDELMKGNYIYVLKISIKNFPKVIPLLIPFNVEITINHAPKFKTDLAPTITVKMTNLPKLWFFSLPEMFDEEPGDKITVFTQFGDAKNFLKLS